ncbi:MAG: hypothetical protein ACMXYF_04090 [Candidatus Woesearchaeota archaeon]
MASDDYEFIKSKNVKQLQQELEEIKANPFVSSSQAKNLAQSVTTLETSIQQMLDLFKQAHEEMTLEEREEKILKAQLEPVHKKIDDLFEQNKTIARGIVTVVESVEHLSAELAHARKKIDSISSRPSAPSPSPLPNPLSSSPSQPNSSQTKSLFDGGPLQPNNANNSQ